MIAISIAAPLVVFFSPERAIQEPVIVAEVREIDVSAIRTSINRIQESFDEINRLVADEALQIETASKTLLEDISDTNKELEDLQQQQDDLLAEVDQLRVLAALTEEQARAVTEALKPRRDIDFGLGLIAGMISGIVVALIAPRLRWMRPHRTEVNGSDHANQEV